MRIILDDLSSGKSFCPVLRYSITVKHIEELARWSCQNLLLELWVHLVDILLFKRLVKHLLLSSTDTVEMSLRIEEGLENSKLSFGGLEDHHFDTFPQRQVLGEDPLEPLVTFHDFFGMRTTGVCLHFQDCEFYRVLLPTTFD